MLQDVRNTCVIRRIRLEGDRKDIVLVVSVDMKVVCSRLVMLELESRQLQLRYMLNPLESKAVELGSWLREAAQRGFLRRGISSGGGAKATIPFC